MRYTILSKGDSKSNTLKHKMMNQMNSFHMIEDAENPEIVICWWRWNTFASFSSV